jgi:hypothetical protein
MQKRLPNCMTLLWSLECLLEEERVRRAKAPFRSMEVVRMPLRERLYAWILRRIFKYNFDGQVLTGFSYPFALAFEW